MREAKSGQEQDRSLRWVGYSEGILEEICLATGGFRLPDLTFDKRIAPSMAAPFPSDQILIYTFGELITANDAILFLREDRIAFMAEAFVFLSCHPLFSKK